MRQSRDNRGSPERGRAAQGQEAVYRVSKKLDGIRGQIVEKRGASEQLDEALNEKTAALSEITSELEMNSAKIFQIRIIDEIETGKTMFGGKVTLSKEDYGALTDLAKKQIAAESKERELTAEVAKLKKEKEELSSENSSLRERVHNAWVEQSSFSAVQKELDALKQKYNKVIEFIESLGLKEKLEKFLNPILQHKRR